jgi:sirohydrochlorin ferrochelatase
VAALADAVARSAVAAETRCGFISGTPAIAAALAGFAARDVLVYPLFMSEGYFTRVRLPQLLAAAAPVSGRRVTLLPALGCDPRLAALIADKAGVAVRARGFAERDVAVVLLAHGSRSDAASRHAAQHAARRIDALRRFAGVACAFLEEPPALADCIAALSGPAVVIGLFVGDGLHGGQDVPALIGALGSRAMFGGNVGSWPEIAGIVTAAVAARVNAILPD